MNKTINVVRISWLFILLGVFFMPFNSWSGLPFLGEYFRDSCFIFFILSFCFLVFKRKILLPLHSPAFLVLVIFFCWIIFATAFNSIDISTYFFKQTTGFNRFLRQFISLSIAGFILPVTFYNVFIDIAFNKLLSKIRLMMLLSLIVVTCYAFVEILVVKFDMIFLKKEVLNLFDYFPFVEAKTDLRLKRISSITFEPPALGTYLITIFGWLASYILTSKKYYNFVPALVVVLLAFASGSRAAFFIIIIQAFLFLMLSIRSKEHFPRVLKLLLFVFTVALVTLFVSGPKVVEYVSKEIKSFQIDDTDHSLSNKSRFGIQYANLKVFLNNPLVGVGFGQQAFEARDLYPNWAKRNNWEFRLKYLNSNDKRFPPGYNLYLRLAAETGIIGLSIFILFVLYILLWCFNNLSNNHVLALIVTVSIIGVLLNWLKMDTFRLYGFWICVSIIFATSQKLQNE